MATPCRKRPFSQTELACSPSSDTNVDPDTLDSNPQRQRLVDLLHTLLLPPPSNWSKNADSGHGLNLANPLLPERESPPPMLHEWSRHEIHADDDACDVSVVRVIAEYLPTHSFWVVRQRFRVSDIVCLGDDFVPCESDTTASAKCEAMIESWRLGSNGANFDRLCGTRCFTADNERLRMIVCASKLFLVEPCSGLISQLDTHDSSPVLRAVDPCPLPLGRIRDCGWAVHALRGTIWRSGGSQGWPLNDEVYKLDTNTLTWTAEGRLPTPLSCHTLSFLPPGLSTSDAKSDGTNGTNGTNGGQGALVVIGGLIRRIINCDCTPACHFAFVTNSDSTTTLTAHDATTAVKKRKNNCHDRLVWHSMRPLMESRYAHSTVVLSGCIVVAGGFGQDGSKLDVPRDTVELLKLSSADDISTRAWETVGRLPPDIPRNLSLQAGNQQLFVIPTAVDEPVLHNRDNPLIVKTMHIAPFTAPSSDSEASESFSVRDYAKLTSNMPLHSQTIVSVPLYD